MDFISRTIFLKAPKTIFESFSSFSNHIIDILDTKHIHTCGEEILGLMSAFLEQNQSADVFQQGKARNLRTT